LGDVSYKNIPQPLLLSPGRRMAGNEPADAPLVGHDVVIHMHPNGPMDRALQLSIR
jgi:hypothetical protein